MAKVKMQCSPYCNFFPDMTCNNWVYDENDPNIKRRKEKKEYICGYDGHVITNWYLPCPKKIDEILNNSKTKGE